MHVIFIVAIVFLLLKWFSWKLTAESLIYFMVKNNIEMPDEQKDEAIKETLYHWFKIKRK